MSASTRTARTTKAAEPIAVVKLSHEKDAAKSAVWKGEAPGQRFGVAWCLSLDGLTEADRARKIRVTVEWDD